MLSRIFLASAGAMALAAAATPANSEERNPPPPQTPPQSSAWDGFYSGANLGGGFGSPPIRTAAVNAYVHPLFTGTGLGPASALSQTGDAQVETAGVIGGGQIGYNLNLYNNFLIGLETDFNGLSQWGHGSFVNGAPDLVGDLAFATVSSEKAVGWLGTVRGRVGWLPMPTVLIYGQGGLAYGAARGDTNVLPLWVLPAFAIPGTWTGAHGDLSSTQVGWTAGGGAEWMFAASWSLKLEYLYYDLGPATWANSPNSAFHPTGGSWQAANVSTSSTRFTGNIVRLGLNFHFGSSALSVFANR